MDMTQALVYLSTLARNGKYEMTLKEAEQVLRNIKAIEDALNEDTKEEEDDD